MATLSRRVSQNGHSTELTMECAQTVDAIKATTASLDSWAKVEIENLKKLPAGYKQRSNNNSGGGGQRQPQGDFTPSEGQKKFMKDLGYAGDFSEFKDYRSFQTKLDELKSNQSGESQDAKNNRIANDAGSDTLTF